MAWRIILKLSFTQNGILIKHKILEIRKIDATIVEDLFKFNFLSNINVNIIRIIANNGEINWLSVGVPIIGLKQETIENVVKLIPKISLIFTDFEIYLIIQ